MISSTIQLMEVSSLTPVSAAVRARIGEYARLWHIQGRGLRQDIMWLLLCGMHQLHALLERQRLCCTAGEQRGHQDQGFHGDSLQCEQQATPVWILDGKR